VTSAQQEQGWLGITAGTTEERLELKDEGEDLAELRGIGTTRRGKGSHCRHYWE